jgi:hypothetical protein
MDTLFLPFDNCDEFESLKVELARADDGSPILLITDLKMEDQMSLTREQAYKLRDLIDQI